MVAVVVLTVFWVEPGNVIKAYNARHHISVQTYDHAQSILRRKQDYFELSSSRSSLQISHDHDHMTVTLSPSARIAQKARVSTAKDVDLLPMRWDMKYCNGFACLVCPNLLRGTPGSVRVPGYTFRQMQDQKIRSRSMHFPT
ncbi:hypothetical protein OE88DRAFT_1291174 [Heliocybe sulcata]|uniref:Uncharacterized protein n=1 Tax=Heliocybe sulcata TaxID=5364 RepID=A0A5C3MKL6_9AGAM|nr:hypothetical protein OE88DRAFT_1291174 [Heliocybe sulcata]